MAWNNLRQYAIVEAPVCTWSPRETEWGCLRMGACGLWCWYRLL